MNATTVRRTATGIHLSRSLAATPHTLFRALSEPEQLLQWWGPPDCRVVECSVDFRVGGVWHYRLASRDGTPHWSRAVYQQIEPDRSIRYTETGSDSAGRVVHDRPAVSGTITLTPTPAPVSTFDHVLAGPSTRLDVALVFLSALERDAAIGNGVVAGFSGALDQLDDLVHAVAATP